MEKSIVKDVVLAITYKCNSRCRMCNIWQSQPQAELKVQDFSNLPKGLREINISGGEPFLREDLIEIIKVIKENNPSARIIISSNGFATDLIIEKIKKILAVDPKIGVSISIDGYGEKHNEIRGIPGGFKKDLETIRALKTLGVKNLRIAFTLGDYNISELRKVYDLAKSEGLELSLAAVHSSENFFNIENKIERKEEMADALDWLINEELRGWNPKRWARGFFAFGLKKFVETGKRILQDYSGTENIFIDPQGNIYPNDISTQNLGNMTDYSWAEKKGVNNIQNWMICTARPAIKKHWLRVGIWILKNKLFSFKKKKQLFLFLLGLIFAILNKIRRTMIGYGNPRPIREGDVEKNIAYDLNSSSAYQKAVREYFNETLEDKDVLEIGPGPDLGVGLLLASQGIKSYTAIDKFKLSRGNQKFYNKLISIFKDQNIFSVKLDGICKGIVSGNFCPEFEYKITSIENLETEKKYDVILSQAVLEHSDNPKLAFKKMFEVLKDGGIICHEIDFKTHTSIIRDLDPLNILRFPEWLYQIIKFPGSPNRLRVNDFNRIAIESGFKDVRIVPLNTMSDYRVSAVKECLARPYSQYSTDDLGVLSAYLIARK